MGSSKLYLRIVGVLLCVSGSVQSTLAQYCTPTYTYACSSNDYIEDFVFHTISNTTSGCNGQSNNYQHYTALSATVVPTATYSMSMRAGSAYSQGFGVWIDFNRDGDFDDAGEFVYASPNASTATFNASVTIPVTAVPGPTRLRVRCKYLGTVQSTESCSNMSFGETEDYNIFITALSGIDIAATKLTSTEPFTLGSNVIRFEYSNLAKDTIQTAEVGYRLNGGTPVINNLTAMDLKTGQTKEHIFSTPVVINSPGSQVLEVWARKPNNKVPDNSTKNDTLRKVICTLLGLSGTYTIGNPGTGSHDYSSINEAISSIKHCGMIGNVIFDIQPGLYKESVVLRNLLTSPNRTITLRSATGKASDVVIEGSGNSTIKLDTASYVRLQNLTIRHLGGSSTMAIHLTNISNNVTIIGCRIELDTLSTASVAGIAASGSSPTSNNYSANDLLIQNNTIIGGYYGICVNGASTYQQVNNIRMVGNVVRKAAYYGIYTYYANITEISNNTIELRPYDGASRTNYGLYIYYSYSDYIIRNNLIRHPQYKGIYLYNCLSAQGAKVYNNMVHTENYTTSSAANGIELSSTRNVDLDFNTVRFKGNSTGAAALDVNSTNNLGIRVRNNILANFGAGYAAEFISDAGGVLESDHNIYYASGTGLAYWGGVHGSLAGLRSANRMDQNSAVLNPGFVSDTDLHVTNAQIGEKGKPIAGITTDIDGDTRSNLSPDPGADEFIASPFNLAISNLRPAQPLVGANQVQVTLVNVGSASLASYTVSLSYSTNGGVTWTTPQTVTLSGLTGPNTSQEFVFNQLWTNTTAGDYNLCARVNPPGIPQDTIKGNEILCRTACIVPKALDTLRVGGSNPDYTTISDAINALRCGITQPVTIKVRPGIYDENVVIPEILGVSNQNRVTITSSTGNASDVIIRVQEGVGVLFNGADFFVLDKVSIENKGSSESAGVLLRNRADNNIIRNCIILMDSISTTSTLYGIGVQNGASSFDFAGDNGILNQILNNKIYGGYYGIQVYGSSSLQRGYGTEVSGNLVKGTYNVGIRFYYHDGSIIRSNMVRLREKNNTSGYGIYVYYDYSGAVISYNHTVKTPDGGIYCYNAYNTDVFNNMVGGGFAYNYAEGISLNSCAGIRVKYNSVNMDHVSTSTFAFPSAIYITGIGSYAVTNNIFAATGGGYGYYVSSSAANYITESENNNIYSSSTRLGYWNTGQVGSLATWRSASGKDAKSVSINPIYHSTTDLHTNNPAINNLGAADQIVKDDFDKQTRHASTPDFGADEFNVNPWDLAVHDITSGIIVKGRNALSVVLRNLGSSSLNGKTVQLQFSGNGGTTWSTAESVTLSGMPSYDSKFTYNFIDSVNVTQDGSVDICVRIQTPVSGDANTVNDKLCKNFCVGLKGTYTVGGPTAFFADWDALFAALNCGIGGKTTIQINPGVYDRKFVFENIPGASGAHELIFESASGKRDDAVLHYTGASSSNFATVQINGLQKVTFRNLTITNDGPTYAAAVNLVGNARNNIVENCLMRVDTSSTSSWQAVVITSSPTSFTGASLSASNNIIRNNDIIGGYYGIRFYGQSTTVKITGNIAENNRISQFYYYGIYSYYHDFGNITGNQISARTNSSGFSRGVYAFYGITEAEISHNRFSSIQFSAIYLSHISALSECKIYNNFMGAGYGSASVAAAAIYLGTGCSKLGFYYNSVWFDSPLDDTQVVLIASNTVTGISFVNNIFYAASGKYVYWLVDKASITSSHNNLLFTTGPFLCNINGTNFAKLADWVSGTGLDTNSLSFKPNLSSSTDLHTRQSELNGKARPITGIDKDIDGESRHAQTPDLGADEFDPIQFDLSIHDMDPLFVKKGDNTMKAILRNEGIASLKDSIVNLRYSSDSGATWNTAEPYTIKGLVTTFDKDTFAFSKPFFVPNTGTYHICMRVDSPGIILDTALYNNKICRSVCVPSTGTYTIGGVNPDYASLSQAIASISCGVEGEVVLNLRPGLYLDSVLIPFIPNSGPTNKLIIQSETGNAQDVIIRRIGTASTTADPATIRLAGAQYVTLRNLTIENQGVNFDAVIQFTGNARHNRIEKCVIRSDSSSTSSSIYAIVSTSAQSVSGAGINGSFNQIVGNLIIGGYDAIYMNGSSNNLRDEGTRIDSNTIIGAHRSALYLQKNDFTSISGNSIRLRSNATTSSYGLYLSESQGSPVIQSNKLWNIGLSSVYLVNVKANPEALISNNFMGGGFKSTAGYNLYLSGCDNIKVYHNSALYDLNGTNTRNVSITTTGNNNLHFVNNSFVNLGGGYTIYAFGAARSAVVKSDHNNLYTTGSNLTYWGSTPTSNLNNHRAASLMDSNSVSVNPGYAGTNDLHSIHPALDRGGEPVGISLDIDGEPRSSRKPDIGADEFILDQFDIGIAEVFPKFAEKGTNTVKVRLINEGLASLVDSVISLSYSTNGGATWTNPETLKLTLLEDPFDEEEYTFSVPWILTNRQKQELCVRINSPGIQPDTNKLNDKVCQSICVGLGAGTLTIGGTNPDFSTISEAIEGLNCGVTGNIDFVIRTGTYAERLLVKSIQNLPVGSTIQFRSETGDARDVKIVSSGGGKDWDHATLQLNGARDLIFKDLSIVNTSKSKSSAVHLLNGTRRIEFRNCQFLVDSQNAFTTVTGLYVAGNSEAYQDASWAHDITVSNCTFVGGYYGLRIVGIDANPSQNIRIDSNRFFSAYTAGVRTESANITSLSGNKIFMRPTNNFNAGVFIKNNAANSRIQGNYILDAGSIGMLLESCKSGAMVTNNMLAGGFRPDGLYGDVGLSLVNSRFIKVYHNSVWYDGTSTVASAFRIEGGDSIHVVNNIFSNTGGGLAYEVITDKALGNSNFNDIYATGSVLGKFKGNQPDLAAWRTAAKRDSNSLSIDPEFLGPGNLHTVNPELNRKGTPLSEIKIDYDGEPRDSVTPDIGADEFSDAPFTDGGIAALVGIKDGDTVKGQFQLKARVQNFGNQAFSNFKMIYTVNGQNAVEENYIPVIYPEKDGVYEFQTPIYFKTPGTYRVCVYTKIFKDTVYTNDTLCINLHSADTSDAGVTQIINITDTVNQASRIVTVVVRNFGNVPIVQFPVSYSVNGTVRATESFPDTLLPGQTSNFTFAAKWLPAQEGWARICAWTGLNLDLKVNNDSVCRDVYVRFDALDGEVTAFLSPGNKMNADSKVEVVVRNAGNLNISNFQLALEVDGTEMDRITVSNILGPGQAVNKEFGYTLPATPGATYNLRAYVQVPGDQNHTNDTLSHTTQVTVGLQTQEDQNVKLFPNPAQKFVFLSLKGQELDPEQVEITDISGRKVLNSSNLQNIGVGLWQVDIQSLTTGTYFVRVRMANKVYTGSLEVLN